MRIVNKNGIFDINAAQYNYLMSTFSFDEIDAKKVSKTNFINSSFEYEKADKMFAQKILSIDEKHNFNSHRIKKGKNNDECLCI